MRSQILLVKNIIQTIVAILAKLDCFKWLVYRSNGIVVLDLKWYKFTEAEEMFSAWQGLLIEALTQLFVRVNQHLTWPAINEAFFDPNQHHFVLAFSLVQSSDASYFLLTLFASFCTFVKFYCKVAFAFEIAIAAKLMSLQHQQQKILCLKTVVRNSYYRIRTQTNS